MEEESFYQSINIAPNQQNGKHTLDVNFEFPFIKASADYDYQIAAVLELKNKKPNYFSINNSKTTPDFHNRKFFISHKK